MVLLQLQEPNVAFGSAPSFASGANYSQSTLNFAINRAYAKAVDDLGDLSLITQTITFPSISQQYSYPIPVAQTASATVTTTGSASATLTGVVLTLTIAGTPVTYTCNAGDTILSALTNLATNVNNSALVTSGTPTISPMQIGLNNPSAYQIYAYTAGTPGNSITVTASSSNSSTIAIAVSSSTLTGGTSASPMIRMVTRCFYQPLGLTYQIELEPGGRMISWERYQRQTSAGYLQTYSVALQPDVCAITPDRTKINFFPGPYNTGDTVTIQYTPQLTSNSLVPASAWGYLVNSTDSPPTSFPEDAQDMIWTYACFLLWPKSREMGTAEMYLKMYEQKKQQVRENYLRSNAGDSIGIRSSDDIIASSGWTSVR